MRKTVLLIFISCLLYNNIYSQRDEKLKNLLKYDQKLLHFGFTVGLGTADFYIRNSDNFFDVSQIGEIYSIENKQSMGFHLGPVSNLRLGKYFDLRLLFNLTFSERTMEYVVLTDTTEQGSFVFKDYEMQLSSTFAEFPLLLKFKSKRINNYRFYVIGGMNFKLDLASKKKIPESELPKIRLKRYDLSYEIGFGMDLYTPYVKIAPEIKFGAGLFNMISPDNTQYTGAMKYMKSKMFMISLHFE